MVINLFYYTVRIEMLHFLYVMLIVIQKNEVDNPSFG